MEDKRKIAIIGGYGGMGRFFAELYIGEGYPVVISGPNETVGKKVAGELGIRYVKDNVKAASEADVVVVSVPIKVTLDVISQVAPHVREGALLMDLTSVKAKPCEMMGKLSSRKVEVIGTHPLFSHRVSGLEGQVVVLTPVRGKRHLKWLRGLLEKHKARVFESTPEEHDRVMAVVQGLTHYAYISFGKTLERLDFDIRESRKFSSPIYELMLDMVGRIIGQNPELYASIQMENPMVPGIHDVYMEVCRDLSKAVREKDAASFTGMMRDAARNFDDVDRAMGRSDKAIYSLVEELSTLKDSIGKEVCLRHIYSGTVHLGTLREVSGEKVVLESGGRVSELKLSNIQVLPDHERKRWKKEMLGIVKRDYSYILDEKADENFLAGLLSGSDENIVGVRIKDVYRGKQLGAGVKSVCFGVELIDSDVGATDGRIKAFFRGIGGVPR